MDCVANAVYCDLPWFSVRLLYERSGCSSVRAIAETRGLSRCCGNAGSNEQRNKHRVFIDNGW
eukprot:COSAG02_NODE_334_length_24367_cov_6.715634_3_plen_63_part_00